MLAHRSKYHYFSFSSPRVQISGSVDNYPVSAITVDTAADISVVSKAWLMPHPTMRSVTSQPVPPSAVALLAANGSPLDVLGFVFISLTLCTITHDVQALVVPSLGPDSILLDNNAMSNAGAVLDWEHQTMSFASTGKYTPAVHSTSQPASRPANPSIASFRNPNLSVAVVHHDAVGVIPSLREHVDLKPRHEALVVA